MKALINADELANDVAGAEALLDRHQEHKVTFLRIHLSSRHSITVQALSFLKLKTKHHATLFSFCSCLFCVYQGEIDAHEDSFRSTDEAGQALLDTGHYASEEVKEKVHLL